MMRLEYAGGTILTGSLIADAVLRYAAALSDADLATPLDVPGRTNEGVEGRFQILLGPASQIMVEPTDDPGEIVDAEFLAETNRLIDVLVAPPNVEPTDERITEGSDDEFA